MSENNKRDWTLECAPPKITLKPEMFFLLVLASCFLLILFLAGKGGALRRACTDGRGWLLMAATVVFGPFVGVSLSLMATQYTSTGVAMTIMSLSPVLILWPAHVLFGQRVTRREVLGALISVAGVALFFV